MQTLAQILAGIPADPYDNQSQGIAPLLQQHMQPGMQSAPGMAPQMQPGMGGAPGGLPPDMLQQLLLRQQQQQQNQQPAPGIGSMGNPMGAGY